MSTSTQTKWRIAAEEVSSCNCDWGCPCQFFALPTHGRCESLAGWEIREGSGIGDPIALRLAALLR